LPAARKIDVFDRVPADEAHAHASDTIQDGTGIQKSREKMITSVVLTTREKVVNDDRSLSTNQQSGLSRIVAYS
jgi:hypothetical protein